MSAVTPVISLTLAVLSASAAAADRLGVDSEQKTLVDLDRANAIAESMQHRTGVKTTAVLINYRPNRAVDDVNWVLARAINYISLVDQGWVPVARANRSTPVAPYALGRTDILHVATPGSSTTAHALARVLVPDAFTYTAYRGDANCLRAVLSTRADACLTSAEQARVYQARFNSQFVALGRGVNLPGDVLLRAPGVQQHDDGVFVGMPIGDANKRTTWHSFDDRYYRALFARIED